MIEIEEQAMVEYGETVGEATGTGSGDGGSSGGGSFDVGSDIVTAATDVVDRVASLPPEVLLLAAVVFLAGLLVLRRAV
jgi:hypothetical protein